MDPLSNQPASPAEKFVLLMSIVGIGFASYHIGRGIIKAKEKYDNYRTQNK